MIYNTIAINVKKEGKIMKKLKSLIAVILCVFVIQSNNIIVFADTGFTEYSDITSNSLSIGIEPYDGAKPDSTWNLKTKGKYSIKGSASQSALYTLYYFTGVESMDITINNKGNREITVKVYKLINNSKVDLLRSKKTISANDKKSWNVGTKNDAKYYIVFSAPCTVTGTVSNGG